jgi:hypothetical protein
MEEPRQSPVLHLSGTERTFPVVGAEGHDLSLRQALEQLVPGDFGIRWIGVDSARQEMKVAWRKDQSWPDAISEVVSSVPGLTVHIGTGSRLVLVRSTVADLRRSSAPGAAPASPGTKEPPPKPLPAPGMQGTNAFLKTSSPPEKTAGTLATVFVSARAAVPEARWTLSVQDQSLRLALERWAQDAGWHLFWELGVDYPIKANASIAGSFEQAVAMVIHSLERADVPPKAIFYRGNQVLRVLPRGTE